MIPSCSWPSHFSRRGHRHCTKVNVQEEYWNNGCWMHTIRITAENKLWLKLILTLNLTSYRCVISRLWSQQQAKPCYRIASYDGIISAVAFRSEPWIEVDWCNPSSQGSRSKWDRSSMPIISLRDFCPSDLSNTELTFRENQLLHFWFYFFPFFLSPLPLYRGCVFP